jgi:hypothetical protein
VSAKNLTLGVLAAALATLLATLAGLLGLLPGLLSALPALLSTLARLLRLLARLLVRILRIRVIHRSAPFFRLVDIVNARRGTKVPPIVVSCAGTRAHAGLISWGGSCV